VLNVAGTFSQNRLFPLTAFELRPGGFIGEKESMRKKLLITTVALAAAVAIAGCEKTPTGKTNQSGSETAKTNEQARLERTQPQQRSEQRPSEAAQQNNPSQGAPTASEQETKPNEAAPGGPGQEATPQESGGGRRQAAQAGTNGSSGNNSPTQPVQQNPTTGQSQGAAPEPGAAQQNQAQQNQTQQHEAQQNQAQQRQAQPSQQQNQSGPNQQAGGSANLSPQQAKGANGLVNLSRDELRQVQMVLKEKGFDIGKIDGVMGPRTRRALIAFQRQQGLQPTGTLDQPSIAALGIANRGGSTTTGQR
jgi:hypothetical protein